MIRVEHLTRRFGERLAVNDASFEIKEGEIVGFLGANGAGKTTTMRMLTGYLMPTSGSIHVAGHNMADGSVEGRAQIGYLPEVAPLYADMTTSAFLGFAARLRGLDRTGARARIAEVLALCGIEEYRDVLLGKLSKGYRQRVGLAQAIIHDPKVLILDEPTAAIDPIQVAETRQLIRYLGRHRTILLSSHILHEVSAICERVIIIHRGRVVVDDRIEDISGRLEGGRRLRLRIDGPAEAVTAALAGIGALRKVTFAAPCHLVEFAEGGEPHAEITRTIVAGNWTLLAMEEVRMDLEEMFLEITADAAGTARQ